MRSRRFRLQAVLDYRERLEQAAQKELAVAAMEHQTEMKRLTEMETRRQAALDDLGAEQAGDVIDVNAIGMKIAYVQALTTAAQKQAKRTGESGERLAGRRSELVERSRDRKSLELLRTREKAEFARWLEATETKEMDEIATMRYTRQAMEGAEGQE